jgi:hypothetical protein
VTTKKIESYLKYIDQALFELDHFLCGVSNDIECIDFESLFKPLMLEITKDKESISKNIDILGNYYSMSEMLDLSRKQWMHENENSEHYEKIDYMCSSIGGICEDTILRILEIHDPDSFIHINDSNFSIQPFLKTINSSERGSILTLKPTYMGVTLDLHMLAKKFRHLIGK